jgi:peptide deformylase
VTALDDAFVTTLKHWRHVRGMSQASLADETTYTASYVSKVESRVARPSAEFADEADRALGAGGALLRAHALVPSTGRRQHQPAATSGALVVLHDEATLTYDGTSYHPTQRRLLRNDGTEPVTRYLVRISVDRYPGDPERSKLLYRERPLTWETLDLWARHNAGPMSLDVKDDWDAVKEVWLRFESPDGRRFPLYPGQEAWIEYGYTVSDEQWGHWYQRAVRHPTRHMAVRLEFPAALLPSVWGMETAPTADAQPLPTAIAQETDGDTVTFSWSTDDPPLQARYRLEWSFAAPPQTTDALPSQTMAAIGVVQEGDPILAEVARPFDLPAEAEDCRRVIAELASAMERVRGAHAFSGGMGIAAPQIGISRAVALVRTPEGEVLTLINPKVIGESEETVEAYEGCLSFFDVRGKAVRPAGLHVEQQDVDGTVRLVSYDGAVAGLVGHEVDHLYGRLYRERMRPGVEPIPVAEYRSSRSA